MKIDLSIIKYFIKINNSIIIFVTKGYLHLNINIFIYLIIYEVMNYRKSLLFAKFQSLIYSIKQSNYQNINSIFQVLLIFHLFF